MNNVNLLKTLGEAFNSSVSEVIKKTSAKPSKLDVKHGKDKESGFYKLNLDTETGKLEFSFVASNYENAIHTIYPIWGNGATIKPTVTGTFKAIEKTMAMYLKIPDRFDEIYNDNKVKTFFESLDEFDLLTACNQYFNAEFETLDKLNAILALSVNDEYLMSEAAFNELAKPKEKEVSKRGEKFVHKQCTVCGELSDEIIENQSSSKFKFYTTTRTTETSKGFDFARCKKCEEDLNVAEQVINKLSSRNNEHSIVYLPLTSDADVMKEIMEAVINSDVKRDEYFKKIITTINESYNEDIDTLVRLSYLKDDKNGLYYFKGYDLISIRELNKWHMIYKEFLSVQEGYNVWGKHKVNLGSSNPAFIILDEEKKRKASKTEERYSAEIIDYFNTGIENTSIKQRIEYYSTIVETNNHDKPNETMLMYKLLYLMTKGYDYMSLINTKEFATGVLVQIVNNMWKRQGKKTASPIAAQISIMKNKENHLDRILGLVLDYISKYQMGKIMNMSGHEKGIFEKCLELIESNKSSSSPSVSFNLGTLANEPFGMQMYKPKDEEEQTENLQN